jgi:hypothetical protein
MNKRIDELSTKLTRIEEMLQKMGNFSIQSTHTIEDDLKTELEKYEKDPFNNFMSLLHLAFKLKNERPDLIDQFPASIQTIIAPSICLRSEDGFLYVFENETFNSPISDQRIATLDSFKPERGHLWSVEPSEDGASVHLKNLHLDKYLYATKARFSERFPESKKLDFDGQALNHSFKWTLYPIDRRVNFFYVKNIGSTEYLKSSCGHSISPIWTACVSRLVISWNFKKC